ncbi:MAG: nuclease-related domain-containing protein [Desulfovermiculus sp.]|nr:nuclease-related domain-containing protein [Desulfovermiculus sp.]
MFLIIFITILTVFILCLLLYFSRFFFERKNHKNPFKGRHLRNPGDSLFKKIDELSDKLLSYVVFFIVFPLILYSVHISQLYFENVKYNITSNIVIISICILIMAYLGYLIVKNLNLRRRYRLAFDGEVYVGQELNQLMLDGYHVFHDFPAEDFNIDHILVGPSGVYAVETKARHKPHTGDSTKDAQVSYDGQTLFFPNWKEQRPLKQAEWQAKWLSNWLQSATGEPVSVGPILALPGWFIIKTSPHGIPVLNPKQIKSFIKRQRRALLNQKQINVICHQLNQKCRDVEPTVSVYDKKLKDILWT